MSIGTRRRTKPAGVTVLRGVPYNTYAQLVSEPKNYGLRMTYHDGTLEIMSPEIVHESPSRQLGNIVLTVCTEFGMPCMWVGAATFRRRGAGPQKGVGKEADESFYIGHAEWLMTKGSVDLDAGDHPPDLWIEVDNRSSSRGKLPLYAALRVPEVWRYRARNKTLVFMRLTDEGRYEPVDQSVALPMLTPSLVLEALVIGEGLLHSGWNLKLREWVREKLAEPA
jgi:Uma2 family endonuclease